MSDPTDPHQPGVEHVQMIDAGRQFVPPGIRTVRLIAVGDGGPGPTLPGRTRRRDRPLIPDASEIGRLPHWAAVAFAARCARRVHPLVATHWPDAPRRALDALEQAVTVAERVAGDGKPEDDTYLRAVESWVKIPYSASRLVSAAARATAAAAHAAQGAVRAAAVHPTDVTDAIDSAVEAVLYSASEPYHLGVFRRDYDRLRAWGRAANWTHATPVAPTVFGPLWPAGGAPTWARQRKRPRG